MRRNEVSEYASVIKGLHWLIALCVILMLCVSFFLGDLPKQMKPMAYMLHKSTGLTVLFLMIIRMFMVIYHGKPALPSSMKSWERILASAVQLGFYVFLILMPLCGWLMSVAANRVPSYFGLFDVPLPGVPHDKALAKFMGQSHQVIAWILIALVVLHIAGALKHYFIDKDDVVQTMLPHK